MKSRCFLCRLQSVEELGDEELRLGARGKTVLETK